MKIICVTDGNCVYSSANDTVNEFKAELLELYTLTYQYHIPEGFLLMALATLTSVQALSLTDHASDIVSSLLLLI